MRFLGEFILYMESVGVVKECIKYETLPFISKAFLENLFDSSSFSIFSWRAGFNLVQNEYRPPHRDLFIYEEPKLCYVLQIGY